MKQTPFYVVGNWKSNKTVTEAVVWLQDFAALWKKQPYQPEKVQVVLCAGFTHLATLASLIESQQLPLLLGAQDVSPYPSGTYTGAVCAAMLADLVRFTLVGHSERRRYFKEQEEVLLQKIEQAKNAQIEPIYCVQNGDMPIPESVSFVGYEPTWAISSGDPYQTQPETAANANQVAQKIKTRAQRDVRVIYGGSTTPENVVSYVQETDISGVLPGGASLTPDTFYRLILNASSA